MTAFFAIATSGAVLWLSIFVSFVKAASVAVTLSSNPTTCSPMTISWDTTGGTGPWTVTVAPLGHVPISIALPNNYMPGTAWSWTWNVPGYASGVSQVIAAVSDSTGKVSGTSALAKLTKAGTCTAPSEQLDFVWYPPKSDPKQCDDWTFTVQEDRNNLGLKLPADILILPENSSPTRLRIAQGDRNKVDWKVNYAHGTKFAVAAFDAGKSGTGGVGADVYTIAKGKSVLCLATTQKEAVAGLREATSTAVAPTQVPTSAASKMATARVSATQAKTSNASSHSPSAVTDSASGSATKASSIATIGGAVGGFVGALAIAGGIYFIYRKRRNRGPDEYGVYPQNEKKSFFANFGSRSDGGFAGANGLGPRFGASGGAQGGISPFTAGRMSLGRWSARPRDSEYDEKYDNSPSRANGGGHGHGHSSSVSLHRSRDSLGPAGAGMTSATGQYGSQNEFSMITGHATFQTDRPREVMGVGALSRPAMTRDGSQQSDPFRNPAPQQWQGSQQQQQYSYQPSPHPASRISPVELAQPPLPPSSSAYPIRGMPGGGNSRDLLANVQSTNNYAPDPFADSPQGRHYTQPSRDESFGRGGAPIHYQNQGASRWENRFGPQTQAPLANRSDMPPPAVGVGMAPRYVDPKESAARFRTLDTQLLHDRDKVVSHRFDDRHSDDEEEGGLPYM